MRIRKEHAELLVHTEVGCQPLDHQRLLLLAGRLLWIGGIEESSQHHPIDMPGSQGHQLVGFLGMRGDDQSHLCRSRFWDVRFQFPCRFDGRPRKGFLVFLRVALVDLERHRGGPVVAVTIHEADEIHEAPAGDLAGKEEFHLQMVDPLIGLLRECGCVLKECLHRSMLLGWHAVDKSDGLSGSRGVSDIVHMPPLQPLDQPRDVGKDRQAICVDHIRDTEQPQRRGHLVITRKPVQVQRPSEEALKVRLEGSLERRIIETTDVKIRSRQPILRPQVIIRTKVIRGPLL